MVCLRVLLRPCPRAPARRVCAPPQQLLLLLLVARQLLHRRTLWMLLLWMHVRQRRCHSVLPLLLRIQLLLLLPTCRCRRRL